MLRRVALVRTDEVEENIAFITKVTRMGGLGQILALISTRSKLRRNTM
jgi:hypothetical protein